MFQSSIAARDQQEARMSAILSELKTTIKDVVEVSAGSSSQRRSSIDSIQSDLSKNPYISGGSKSDAKVAARKTGAPDNKDNEMSEFAEEVQCEEQRRLSEKVKALGVHSVVPTDESPHGSDVLVCPHCNASLATKKQTSTNEAEDSKAVNTKRASKAKPLGSFAKSQSANASMLIDHSTNKSTLTSPPSFKAPTPRQETAPASESLPTSAALWSKLQGRVQAIESQWSEAVRHTRSHASTGVQPHALSEHYLSSGQKSGAHHSPSSGFAGGMTSELEEDVLGVQTSGEAMVHHMMGVSRKVGGVSTSDESHGNLKCHRTDFELNVFV